jgi:hypothetical protein
LEKLKLLSICKALYQEWKALSEVEEKLFLRTRKNVAAVPSPSATLFSSSLVLR